MRHLALALVLGLLAAPADVVSLRGTWDGHIQHTSGRVVDEQWIVDQNAAKLTGRVKTASGQDLPLEGTVDGTKATVTVTVRPDRTNIFRATVDDGVLNGSIEQTGEKPDNGTFSPRRPPAQAARG